jgi:hypothetical protein
LLFLILNIHQHEKASNHVGLILTTFLSFADNPSTVKIKTSAICEMCKERIEKRLAFTKGKRCESKFG